MAFITFLIIGITSAFLPMLHLWVSPYTKVEESFNIQAIHDIQAYGIPTSNATDVFKSHYDHMTFPGAVPRTFVGALLVAGLSKVSFGFVSFADQQLQARSMLARINAAALLVFAVNVRKHFGQSTAIWYILIQGSQFHVSYYASRPLPNMFAFGISTVALANLLPRPFPSHQSQNNNRLALYLLTVAGIVFRSELSVLLASYVLLLYSFGKLSFRKDLVPLAIIGLITGLTLTIPVDTYFWQSDTPLWPELSAFLSNVTPTEESTGASAWGISPWHWYFTSALPRLLMNPFTILLIFFAFWLPTRGISLLLLFPSILYIALYSFLPHKETRFIMYAIPMFNVVAAQSANYLWNRRAKNLVARLSAFGILLSTVLTAIISHAILLPVSSLNYPGGHALQTLHSLARNDTRPVLTVHLDNLSLQTGITRFQQLPSQPPAASSASESPEHTAWLYDKTSPSESQRQSLEFWNQFDYAIVEVPSTALGSWDIIGSTKGIGGFRIIRTQDDGSERPGRTADVIAAMYQRVPQIALLWNEVVERWIRPYVVKPMTGGKWAELYMEDKLYILKRQ